MDYDALRFGSSKRGDHNELDDFVQGKGQYTSDIELPGQLFACFVRSPVAAARIKKIDTSVASVMSGVHLVVTGEQLVKAGIGQILPLAIFNGRDGQPMKQAGIPVLPYPEVRYVGEAVAMVVAVDVATAQSAAEQVVIEWELQASVTEPLAAIEVSAPSVHLNFRSNIALDWEDGDLAKSEAAFAQAHFVESVDLADPPMTACSIEPKAAIAHWDASSSRFTLIASTQGVMLVRKILAEQVFKIAPENLRVITPHVGGGFGVKVQTYAEYAAILFASRLLSRAVKWTATRLECFLTDTHSRNSTLRARMAFDAQGRILGLQADVIVGIGAYTSTYVGIVATNNLKNCLSSVYCIPSIQMRSRLVFTNMMPHGPYRGAGRPEAIYMIERLIDKAAVSLGLDRVELRRRNLIPASAMPYSAPNGQVYDSGEFEVVMNKALALSDWSDFESRRLASAEQGKLRGIGVCCFLEVAGGILEEPADLRFSEDRIVSIHIGAQDLGQGHLSTYPALVAKRLGIDVSQIRLVAGDSDKTPGLVATVASRSTMMAGSAVVLACDEAIRRGKLIASHLLEAGEFDIEFINGKFQVKGTDKVIALLDLPARLTPSRERPGDLPDTLNNVAKFVSPTMSFPNGCHVCEVEIDSATGLVSVVRHTAVDDVGVMLNPTVVQGQVLGGIAQGLGQVLGERLHYDADGQLLNASFMDYPIPRADMLPPITLGHHEVPCRNNPLGVKGAGESGVAGAMPAAVNAILHALSYRGVQSMDMPFTPNRVWTALSQTTG
ncbi:MAG: xanthine dehydrogenase family protein molybdopterin-binding subunit [Burkholderiaceae bacterium]